MPKGAASLAIVVFLAASGMLAACLQIKIAMANPTMIPPMPETPDLN